MQSNLKNVPKWQEGPETMQKLKEIKRKTPNRQG